ncbi:MAG: hypothetical protein ICV78_10965 [Tolypothrix sp. Co-bin9]|nr:hypothetical protein [Tolypothrix sp. Co-bin9]
MLLGLYSLVQFPSNNDNFDECSSWYENFLNFSEQLDKSSAIELIEFLPALASAKKMFLTDEQCDITRRYYTGMSKWLRCWEDNVETSELQKSEYAIYEGAAVEAKRRYELISALFSRDLVDKIFFPNTNLSWLLAQTSIFWGQMGNKCSSREELYQNVREYVNSLDDFGGEPPSYQDTLENTQLYHADSYFDTLARDVAANDCDFDNYYFKPYILAKRQWNSYGRKKLEMVHIGKIPPKPRRGTKLGYKKNS